MTSEDPWQGIRPPAPPGLNARRVDHDAPWDLFRAIDGNGHRLLLLQHRTGAATPSSRLPRLQGLRIEAQTVPDGERLLIRLLDGEQKEVFHSFCEDVVRATGLATTEEEAVERFLGRTWRWHRLLRTGRSAKLTDSRQRGLMGELRLLEKRLLPVLGAADAARCWTGPLHARRDFEIAAVHVEAKARRPTQSAVTISSEQQLDSDGCDRLFLYVAEVAAMEGPDGGLDLTEAARRVRGAFASESPLAAAIFEERLFAAGFDWEHDYSDQPWLLATETLFEVRDEFPRITTDTIPTGIDNASYRLALAQCEDYRADFPTLEAALGRSA